MGLVELIVVIAVVGLFVWAITALVPMPAQFKNAIYVLSVVFLVLYVLKAFDLLSQLNLHLR